MAMTRIIPMHLNKGKSIKQCLSNRLDYGKNPDKTENGTFISSYACDPETADADFALLKREYFQLTGRKQDSDVIAYQVRQSFKPGEITPEEANRIGYEFAEHFLKGNHPFIVCTHTDKDDAMNMNQFLALVKKYTEVQELTAEIIREFVEKIYVYQAEKVDGHRVQRIKVVWNHIGELPSTSSKA